MFPLEHMPETIELEEIVFEAPSREETLVINPDLWVERVIRDQLVQEHERRNRQKMKSRPRIVADRKAFICVACMAGQHRKCAENGCPCVHKCLSPRPARNDFQGENIPTPVLETELDDCCWWEV